ncbi:hypothetical protein BDW75DRAFT_18480 [Aspergillus navahoensis]
MPPSRPRATANPNPATRTRNCTTLSHLLNYTVFIFLSILLLCLILLTPADAIYQCYVTHRLTNIFIITGGYLVTFLLAVLIYATRIYTNRSVLGGIPKAWIPVEKEDVGKSVRRLVVEGLGRSALIARGARPRNLGRGSGANASRDGNSDGQALADAEAGAGAGAGDVEEREGLLRGFDYDVDPENPPWGVIEHPGWSAPESSLSASAPDQGTSDGDTQMPTPGLCYRTVIRELPHLIEAKAVSLAPPDPFITVHPPNQSQAGEGEGDGAGDAPSGLPDTRIVAILRRPGTMSLRSYINHLISLSILHPPETGLEFLALYERARFSGKELYEDEFRELMGVFADVLRGMRFDREHHRLLLDMDEYNENGDFARSSRNTGAFAPSLFGSKSESVIGPSDEEGETTETDTLGSVNVDIGSPRRRHRHRPQTRSGPRPRPAYGYGYTYNYASGDLHLDRTGPVSASRPPPGQSRSRSRSRSRGRIDFNTGVGKGNSMYWSRTGAGTPSTHSAHSLHSVRSNSSGLGEGSGVSLRSASRSDLVSGSSSGSVSGGSVIRLADARTENISRLPYVLGEM